MISINVEIDKIEQKIRIGKENIILVDVLEKYLKKLKKAKELKDIINSIVKYKYSDTSIMKLVTLRWELRILMIVGARYEDIIVVETERGEAKQELAFQKGYSKAHYLESAHNFVISKAVDIASFPYKHCGKYDYAFLGGKIMFISDMLVKYGVLKNGVTWGGKWSKNKIKLNSFIDLPHYQIYNWRNDNINDQENEKMFLFAVEKVQELISQNIL